MHAGLNWRGNGHKRSAYNPSETSVSCCETKENRISYVAQLRKDPQPLCFYFGLLKDEVQGAPSYAIWKAWCRLQHAPLAG